MTLILGFNCHDGIVLCSDSLESDGQTKSKVNKIWAYQTDGEWGISVGGAGEADFCESFTDNLKVLYDGESFDKDKILLQLRTAIKAARITYPDLEWEALFGFFGPRQLDRKLLRLSRYSKHLGPVIRYEAVGIGSHLAKFLCSQMYRAFMGVDEAVELGVFITQQCIQHVSGVDGPISVLTYRIGQPRWYPYSPEEIKAIEDRLRNAGSLQKTIRDFWISLTPTFDLPPNIAHVIIRHPNC